jgi:hypothetical protein
MAEGRVEAILIRIGVVGLEIYITGNSDFSAQNSLFCNRYNSSLFQIQNLVYECKSLLNFETLD